MIVPQAQQLPVPDLPEETLLFLLGSRYCETDRLSETAWNLFGQAPTGWGRVQAICDYVHRHITFGYEHARMTRTALEAFHDKTGVCRDYAHLAVAFCRCMNIPARYCTGYLGDIGMPPPYGPMDFAAWFEAFLDGHWYTFDARNNTPRIGRVLIARGRDASDVAISSTFGPNTLTSFRVWTDGSTRLEPGYACEENGVADGTRTHDNRNHNPGLYQLSYSHRCCRMTCIASSGARRPGLEPVTPGFEGRCSINELRALPSKPRRSACSLVGVEDLNPDILLPQRCRAALHPGEAHYRAPSGAEPTRGRAGARARSAILPVRMSLNITPLSPSEAVARMGESGAVVLEEEARKPITLAIAGERRGGEATAFRVNAATAA